MSSLMWKKELLVCDAEGPACFCILALHAKIPSTARPSLKQSVAWHADLNHNCRLEHSHNVPLCAEICCQHASITQVPQRTFSALQFGSYLPEPPLPSWGNLTGASPAAGYTLFDYIDILQQDNFGLYPITDTCFDTSMTLNQNQTNVNECIKGAGDPVCCYSFQDHPMSAVSHASLPSAQHLHCVSLQGFLGA